MDTSSYLPKATACHGTKCQPVGCSCGQGSTNPYECGPIQEHVQQATVSSRAPASAWACGASLLLTNPD
ncbi:hypothetical protein K437DRAFT_253721, partial [Tilletiaria anomala UBC 951]